MPYRFRLQEPLDDGVRRIAREQLERALADFGPGFSRDAAIHGARRRLKKVRTLLRLIRPGLGEKKYRRHNTSLRDAGLALAGARDAFVVAATLDGLERTAPARLKPVVRTLSTIAKDDRLRGEHAAGHADVDDGVGRIRAYLDDLDDLHCSQLSIDDLGEGLRQTMAQSRKAFSLACENDDDETLHEWRKTVQRHYRQMLLLYSAWPDFYETRAQLAAKIGQGLGADHDLSLVKAFVSNQAGGGVTEKQAEGLLAFCEARQSQLRDQLKSSGSVMLAASPKALARETAIYWKAAKARKLSKAVVGEIARFGPSSESVQSALADADEVTTE